MIQHFVITGANRGIGLGLVRQVLGAGHRVTAVVREPQKALELLGQQKQVGERLRILSGDVSSDSSMGELGRELSGDTIDVLINCAGAYLEKWEKLPKLSPQILMDTFSINAVGPFRVTQALLTSLQKSKSPKLVNITSLMGSITDNTSGGVYGYRMSKAALNMFCKSFSIDFPEISSVVIHPGWVKTDMGGAQAPTSTDDSAKGILRVVSGLGPQNSGKFFDFEGEELPW